MSYEMQVRVGDEWRSVRATDGKEPYRYPDRKSAERMLRICYPDQLCEQRLGGPLTVRVVEVSAPANMEEYR
jgi:hypothetical protein